MSIKDQLGIDSVYGYTDEENSEPDDDEVAANLAAYNAFNAITEASDTGPVHLGNIDADQGNADWLKTKKDQKASGVDIASSDQPK
jgi:hypothetical protein